MEQKFFKAPVHYWTNFLYKKVHVVAVNFCFGSKFEFVNPLEIDAKQNCMKNLNEFVYWSEGIDALIQLKLFIETI